ncbi:MAG: carboxypeptidase-like regulatory domain-containing protein, partial [Acidobacteriota bacterium]
MYVRVICLMLLVASASIAQEFRASISGTVRDSRGGSVQAARVVARNVERGLQYESLTDSNGQYRIDFLLAGSYTLRVEKPQFKTFVREGLSISSTDRIAVDVPLELGVISESIIVVGDAPLLREADATRLGVIENRTLERVPAGGRNVFALQYDLPGVVKTSTYWGSMELYAFGNVNSVSINGGKVGENEITIDGLTDTKSDRSVVFVPALSAIQEFTVQTNSYDAQFGRLGGGVSMLNLKSGTNLLHGQLYDYFKNDKLRANDWVNNKNSSPRPPFKNNTFGFEFDGPVVIPGVADGRNKVFFLLSYEGLREHAAGGQVRTLPLPEQRGGDFSQLYNDAGNLITLYDPQTTRLGPDGKTYVRTAFLGNIIPLNRINPVAAKATSFYPVPNLPGDGPGHQNNYSRVLPNTNGYDSWLG